MKRCHVCETPLVGHVSIKKTETGGLKILFGLSLIEMMVLFIAVVTCVKRKSRLFSIGFELLRPVGTGFWTPRGESKIRQGTSPS